MGATAPSHRWTFAHLQLSKWTASTWDIDPLIKAWAEEDRRLATGEANQYAGGSTSFGHWSANGVFRLERVWVDYKEDEGIGRGPNDTVQEKMAEVIVKNQRALTTGRGGTGKGHLIKLLLPMLEALVYKVMCVAFTQVAVANTNSAEYPAYTILHLLHRFIRNKRTGRNTPSLLANAQW